MGRQLDKLFIRSTLGSILVTIGIHCGLLVNQARQFVEQTKFSGG